MTTIARLFQYLRYEVMKFLVIKSLYMIANYDNTIVPIALAGTNFNILMPKEG